MGYTTHTCTACGDSYVDSYVNALGHKYNSVVTAPTFTEQGYTTYTCTVCNHSYKDNYVDVLTATFAVNGTNYATLEEAIAAANAGDTIQLVADVSVETLFLNKDIKLDLNGKTLTADAVIAFNGNDIVDNSTDKTGRLVVDKTSLVLAADNEQMPIWTGSGYAFTAVKHQIKLEQVEVDGEDGTTTVSHKITFKPSFKTTADLNGLLAGGAENAGLRIMLRVTWKSADGTTSIEDFVYSDNMVEKVYGEGGVLTLTITGTENYTDLNAFIVVESVTGVVSSGDKVVITNN